MVKNIISSKAKHTIVNARRSRSRPHLESTGNIRVFIRVRPFQQKEQTDNNRNVIATLDDNTVVFDPTEENNPFFYHGVQQKQRDIMKRVNKNLKFTFDRVFSDDANNEVVFESSTKTLIDSLMMGFNCSVFVYGATGAGKTHTMLGKIEDPGITFLTLTELFKQKHELEDEREFDIRVTYLEVYNENVRDLLNPGVALNLREDANFGIVVAGLKMYSITEEEMAFQLLDQGNRNRTQHPTDANAESSRSHAVFQLYIQMKNKKTKEVLLSKLSMIDLAGSERGSSTGYLGARFTEGANINKSLLALGNCINSLADGLKHIPYRNSKLTRLLKDSLGGNCQTVMIANVSPSSFNYEDTYNTLKYASRAKKIKSIKKKNVLPSESSLNHYIQLVEKLTKENSELKTQLETMQSNCHCNTSSFKPEQVHEKVSQSEPDNPVKSSSELDDHFQKLYEEKKHCEHRIGQLKSVKHMAMLRKQLKEENDTRLSGFCADVEEKQNCRMRLGNAMERLDRQASCVQEDINNLEKRNDALERDIQEIVKSNSQLKLKFDVQNAEILHIRMRQKADHLQKVCDFQTGELRLRDQIIEKFSEILPSCFLQLRGHGLATESLATKYQGLIRYLQGTRSVWWEEETEECDSGISIALEKDSKPDFSKRKSFSDLSLNNTFVVSMKKSSETDKKVVDVLDDENCNGMDLTFRISYSELEDEVFVDNKTFQRDNGAKQEDRLDNVGAEKLMFRVNDKVHNLPVSDLQFQTQTVSAKQLMRKVCKSASNYSSSSGKSTILHKENRKPYVRSEIKYADKNKKPSIRERAASSTRERTLQKPNFKF